MAERVELSVQQTKRVIRQGDIYWVTLKDSDGVDAHPHPHVVVQENGLKHSSISSVLVCGLTSNLKRISDIPGSVLLEAGEANLPRQSVVNVAAVSVIDESELGDYIGSLSQERIHQIVEGMRFLQRLLDR
jgi:mRNA interferase MazF